MFVRISPKTSRGRWLRLMLTLKKFRLVIVSGLSTVLNRPRSVIYQLGGEVAARW